MRFSPIWHTTIIKTPTRNIPYYRKYWDMDRYGDVPIFYTRLGVTADAYLDVSEVYYPSFTREQFAELTGLGESSIRDKLRDMEKYGFVERDKKTYTSTKRGIAIKTGGPERQAAMWEAINLEPLWVGAIRAIGDKPERGVFDRWLKGLNEEYNNFSQEILDNIWSAFVSDISCTTRAPPYKGKITDVIKRKPSFTPPPISPTANNIPQNEVKKNEPAIQTKIQEVHMEAPNEKPQPSGSITVVSQDLIGLAEYLPSTEKVMIEFGKVKFELRDESSIALAKVLIRVKEKGLQGVHGNDHE